MINQLLDVPYFNERNIPENLFIPPKRVIVASSPPSFFHSPCDLFMHAMNQNLKLPIDYKGNKIDNREDVISIFHHESFAIEKQLLSYLVEEEVGWVECLPFKKLTIEENCRVLGIESYLEDRNLFDLIYYWDLLKENKLKPAKNNWSSVCS